MNEKTALPPQNIAAALSQALQSDAHGEGHHVAIKAVADLAGVVRHDADGRAALIKAATERFANYRKITARGGQSFDVLALATTEEKILFHGLRQKLPMQQVIPADEARHYTKYGVTAFAQAFQGSQQHLAALSPSDVAAEVARQVPFELAGVYQHKRLMSSGSSGAYPVFEQLAPLYSAVSVVPSLGQAVEQGVHGGVSSFLARYGALGRPSVQHMVDHGRECAPIVASFVREALTWHDAASATEALHSTRPGVTAGRSLPHSTLG